MLRLRMLKQSNCRRRWLSDLEDKMACNVSADVVIDVLAYLTHVLVRSVVRNRSHDDELVDCEEYVGLYSEDFM